MTARLLTGALTVALLTGLTIPAGAQDVTADVKTWGGQAWRLSEASLEVFYTLVPQPKGEGAAAAPAAGAATAGGVYGGSSLSGGMSRGAMFFGSLKDIGALVAPEPQALQGRAPVEAVTVVQGGIETLVPLASIASVTFSRQLIAGSQLPPYLASTHFRYGATVVLTDGSRVEGDYVNLGTTIVRGMTPQGRVDIPWGDVETISFQR